MMILIEAEKIFDKTFAYDEIKIKHNSEMRSTEGKRRIKL